MTKIIKISIVSTSIILLLAVAAGGYFLYKNQQAKRAQESHERREKQKTNEPNKLKEGTSTPPKTESPVPVGIAGPAPLPN